MKQALWAALVALPLLGAGALPAHAQGSPESAETDQVRAQELYNAGLRAYNVGDFDQAIKDWKAAYQFMGVPDFLFNIAQAYRQKRDYSEAVFFYNAYLRGKPDAVNVAEVTALRDEMSALLEAQKSTEAMPPDPLVVVDPAGEEGTTSAPSAVSAVDTSVAVDTSTVDTYRSDSSAGRGLRLGGIIAGGSGVALVATGVAFVLSASATESDLERAASDLEVWSDEYADMEKSAELKGTIGTVLLIAGGAAITGGGVLYFLGNKKRNRSGLASLRVEPTLNLENQPSAGLVMGWNY